MEGMQMIYRTFRILETGAYIGSKTLGANGLSSYIKAGFVVYLTNRELELRR